jgi:hypothetical protein
VLLDCHWISRKVADISVCCAKKEEEFLSSRYALAISAAAKISSIASGIASLVVG